MVVAFTITRINYLVASLFCDMVLLLSYVYWPAIYICGIKWFWLRYLPCFRHSDESGYGFPEIIHHIVVGAHQAELVPYYNIVVIKLPFFTELTTFRKG